MLSTHSDIQEVDGGQVHNAKAKPPTDTTLFLGLAPNEFRPRGHGTEVDTPVERRQTADRVFEQRNSL